MKLLFRVRLHLLAERGWPMLLPIAYEQAHTAFHLFLSRGFQHVFVHGFVSFGQFVGLQVIVDEGNCVLSYFYFIEYRTVVLAGIIQYACRENRILGVTCYLVGVSFFPAHRVDAVIWICLEFPFHIFCERCRDDSVVEYSWRQRISALLSFK